MREILFRGKRKDNEEWVKGHLGIEVGNQIVIEYCDFDDILDEYCVEERFIIPETVGQYTGLTDKNGLTKIFEGDIVRYELHEIKNTAVIKYGAPKEESVCYGWYLDDNNGNTAFLFCRNFIKDYNCQVIGNIHDTPELLK